LARGLKQTASGREAEVPPLAQALSERFKVRFSKTALDPVNQTVVRAAPSDRNSKTDHNVLLHEVDRLMARVAQKTIEPPEVMEQLKPILERAFGVADPSARN